MDYIEHIMPFFQIIVAMLLGTVLGLERTLAGKTAGMRTYGLVTMGSCLFILISNLVISSYPSTVNYDPMHLASGVITGIGFLGAGLIIFKEDKLSGLTTAAGLWVACGIGIAVGFQLFAIAIFATLLTFLNFTILWIVEKKVKEFSKKDGLML
ncbi:MgtC/SapB family protein [Candidatus Parcubacteria bacterium]|nr:MgtC/SapB family protein [Candidatus Parcubacteria bacterium]